MERQSLSISQIRQVSPKVSPLFETLVIIIISITYALKLSVTLIERKIDSSFMMAENIRNIEQVRLRGCFLGGDRWGDS